MNNSTDTDVVRRELDSSGSRRLERLETLIRLAEEERSILVQGRHADLEANLGAQDRLLAEVRQLDKREEKASMMLEEGSLGPALHVEHAKAADRLRSLVEVNTELIQNAMRFVNFSLGVLMSLASEQQGGQGNPAILLDRKA